MYFQSYRYGTPLDFLVSVFSFYRMHSALTACCNRAAGDQDVVHAWMKLEEELVQETSNNKLGQPPNKL